MKILKRLNYHFWRTLFRLTPGRWIIHGCSFRWNYPGAIFGRWVTTQYGSSAYDPDLYLDSYDDDPK